MNQNQVNASDETLKESFQPYGEENDVQDEAISVQQRRDSCNQEDDEDQGN